MSNQCEIEAQRSQAKETTRYILNAICNDPRMYWVLGEGTESWEKLTALHSALWGFPLDKIRENFKPDRNKYAAYIKEREENARLLELGREYDTTGRCGPREISR